MKNTDKWNDAPKRPGRNEGPPREPRREGDRPPRRFDGGSDERRHYRRDDDRPYRRPGKAPAKKQSDEPEDGLIRLNRYLAHSGIGSRREADDLIRAGVVKVNGQTVTELGVKVKPGTDIVHVQEQKMSMEVKRYVLLNKPKDTITTTDDPHDRKTVMGLVADACEEQIFPVGRLDRQTSGLLLFTNDGDLANNLTHPRYGIEKIYHVTLDRNVSVEDLRQLAEGVQLEDGLAQADEVSYVGESKSEVGMRLHTGRNRVVRRMFEALRYDVVKLDRVLFAGLTKKDLPRGRYRHLTDAEVGLLKRVK